MEDLWVILGLHCDSLRCMSPLFENKCESNKVSFVIAYKLRKVRRLRKEMVDLTLAFDI